ASIFNAFGSRVTLFEAAPRILMSEDEQVAAAMSTALQASGVRVLEDAGTIERFEPSPAGVRLVYSGSDAQAEIDATLAVVAVGEAAARETHDVVVGAEGFDSMPRPIIDGRPTGFCKLVADRETHTILGCHIVGERAVELAQLAALAVASGMKVEQLALVPF